MLTSIDTGFIEDLKRNKKPLMLAMGSEVELIDVGGGVNRVIPHPDKQLMYEIALAYQSFLRRQK